MPETTSNLYCPRCLTTFDHDAEQCTNLGCRRARPKTGWGRIFEAGEVFDRNYRLHRMLAIGGAGVTYVAREIGADGSEVGPELAIKVLLTARDQGPYLRRLATEAQIIQELDHPNIVQYLGFVHRAGHSPYLITRFEAGGSLLDHMRRLGTLTVRDAAQVGRQICWALEKAHERGIVHRDLKPENVLLTRKFEAGEALVVRVADFGIAKVSGSLGSNVTRVGAFVGTPHYAAPEQFVGGAVTRAADVYAVGALLHFCLTAQHVVQFADRLDPEDSFQLLKDHLPPEVSRSDEPTDDVRRMNLVLSVAMAVEPNDRCSVIGLDEMLATLVAGRDPVPRPAAEAAAPLPEIASVTGIAGAMGTATCGGPVERAETEPRAPARTLAVPQPSTTTPIEKADSTRTMDPVPTRDPEPARRGGAGWLVAGVGVLAIGFLVVAGGALAWFGLPSFGPPPVDLTGQESDAAAIRDYAAIRRSLDALGTWLHRQCEVEAGTRVDVEMVLEPDGSVRSAEVTAGDPSGCVADAIEEAIFARTGGKPVRVRMPVYW